MASRAVVMVFLKASRCHMEAITASSRTRRNISFTDQSLFHFVLYCCRENLSRINYPTCNTNVKPEGAGPDGSPTGSGPQVDT